LLDRDPTIRTRRPPGAVLQPNSRLSVGQVPPASSGHPVVPTRLPPACSTAGSTPAGNDVHHQTAFLEVRVPDEKLRDTNQPT
jgi:hypothetical protein